MIVFAQSAKTKQTILILEPLTSGKPMVVDMVHASQTWHTPLDQGIRGRFLFFVSHCARLSARNANVGGKWHSKDILKEESNNATALLEQFLKSERGP
jgi:hypothetical protein